VRINAFNVIGGGYKNIEQNPSLGVIAGGWQNLLDTLAWGSTIAGGDSNIVHAEISTIGGGRYNVIDDSWVRDATIAGGQSNQFWHASGGFIGGGVGNYAGYNYTTLVGGDTNTSYASVGFLGGGAHNLLDWASDTSVLVGGAFNYLNGHWAFLGGGLRNRIDNNSHYSVLVGGDTNLVSSQQSFLGGGRINKIDISSDCSVLGGGASNYTGAAYTTLGGGIGNKIDVGSKNAFIGGGASNYVSNTSAVIGGGSSNSVKSSLGTITGGSGNIVNPSADHSFIGGGNTNTISSSNGAISGGSSNSVSGLSGTIGGGTQNNIASSISNGNADYGSVLGGTLNNIQLLEASFGVTALLLPQYASIGGGLGNDAEGHFAAIGGGRLNKAVGKYATIPGGYMLDARDYETVIGIANKQYATLINNTGNPLASTETLPAGDDRSFIIGNGTVNSDGGATRSNAFEVSRNGHSIVFHRHGTGGAEIYAVGGGGSCSNGGPDVMHHPAIIGATYQDNIIYAWGDIVPDPQGSCGFGRSDPSDVNNVNVLADFGVREVQRLNQGIYEITLDLIKPDGATSTTFEPNIPIPACAVAGSGGSGPIAGIAGKLAASVVVSLIEDGMNEFSRCATISATRIDAGTMKFQVFIRDQNCDPLDRSFTFQVTGRPQN